LPDIPKHSAFDAFCAFWQSLSATPVNPAHAFCGVAAGGGVAGAGLVVTDDDELFVVADVPAGDCANNGAATIIDRAHAIAFILQRFMKSSVREAQHVSIQAHGCDRRACFRRQCRAHRVIS
jgi:hypothetical protein